MSWLAAFFARVANADGGSSTTTTTTAEVAPAKKHQVHQGVHHVGKDGQHDRVSAPHQRPVRHRDIPGDVVVAVDGSPGSFEAFEFAAHHADEVDTLVLTTGVFRSRGSGRILETEPEPEPDETELKHLQKDLKRLCERHQRRCQFATLEYETVSQLGYLMNRFAAERRAKSLVVGLRGYSAPPTAPWSGYTMGSVSSSILQQAQRPVTVVRPQPHPEHEELSPPPLTSGPVWLENQYNEHQYHSVHDAAHHSR